MLRIIIHLDIVLVQVSTAVPYPHHVRIPLLVTLHVLLVDLLLGVVVADERKYQAGCTSELLDVEGELLVHLEQHVRVP